MTSVYWSCFIVPGALALLLGAHVAGAQENQDSQHDLTTEELVAVEEHDWKNQTKLGLKYLFSPRKAFTAQVFRIYDIRDVRDVIWPDGDVKDSSIDVVLYSDESEIGLVLKTPHVGHWFAQQDYFEALEERLAKQGISVGVAVAEPLKGVKPEHLAIHWPGSTPESVGIQADTVTLAHYLITSDDWNEVFADD